MAKAKEQKTLYYSDELNDDFYELETPCKKLGDDFKYLHRNPLWNVCSSFLYRCIAMPFAYLFCKAQQRVKYVGREKLKTCKKQGYYLYGNHTQGAFDAYSPNLINHPKRTQIITADDATSIKGLKNIVCMLGAIPVPDSLTTTKNFYSAISYHIAQNRCICVYPEAHIWPYYTKIRPFKSTCFRYPVMTDSPSYCFTTTYQKYGKKDKVRAVVYIDGPFYADKTKPQKEQIQNLRDQIYQAMCDRSAKNDVEVVKYIKK